MVSSSSPLASAQDHNRPTDRMQTVIAALEWLRDDKSRKCIAAYLQNYLRYQVVNKMTEDTMVVLENIVQDYGDKAQILDELINAVPGAKKYICDRLWRNGFEYEDAGQRHCLDAAQDARIAYLKYYLIEEAEISTFDAQSRALSKLTSENFDTLVKDAYASINMEENVNERPLKAHWTACEEFMCKSYNRKNPLWRFFQVIGMVDKYVDQYNPPHNMMWVKSLLGADWSVFKGFVTTFIGNHKDFFESKLRLPQDEDIDDTDEKHLHFHIVHPMLKEFMREFYDKLGYDPVDVFTQCIFGKAGKDKENWTADVIEFNGNLKDPDLKELIYAILLRDENTLKSSKEAPLPNLHNVNIFGYPGIEGKWRFKEIKPLMRAVNGLIRKLRLYSLREGQEDEAMAILRTDITEGRFPIYLGNFDALGNYVAPEMPLSEEFRKKYLIDPNAKVDISPFSREHLESRPNYVEPPAPVEPSKPSLSDLLKPKETKVESKSSWDIYSVLKTISLVILAIVCCEALNYTFRRTFISRAKAAFGNAVSK